MSFIDRQLMEDEVVVARANRTNWMYFNEIMFSFVILLYFLYLWLILKIDNIFKASLAVLPFLVIWFVIFIIEVVKDLSIELVVTNKRVIGKTGLIRLKTIDVPIENIDNVQINCTILGRILKYGTITIESKSDAYVFTNLRKPFSLKEKIVEKKLLIREPESE